LPVSSLAPPRNVLLACLPADVLARLMPQLTLVPLVARQVVYTAEAEIDAVYFPEEGMLSMVANLEEGVQVEVGMIGREGVAGGGVVRGAATAFNACMVQLPGSALRMGVAAFRRAAEASPELLSLVLRHGEAYGAQVAQTAACNGRHELEQRLSRWLLMAHDRAGEDEIPLSQEFLAMMLGVHRPSVTVTAGILQRAGLIRHGGGRVTILDRAGLEASACECYRTVQRRAETVMGPPFPARLGRQPGPTVSPVGAEPPGGAGSTAAHAPRRAGC